MTYLLESVCFIVKSIELFMWNVLIARIHSSLVRNVYPTFNSPSDHGYELLKTLLDVSSSCKSMFVICCGGLYTWLGGNGIWWSSSSMLLFNIWSTCVSVSSSSSSTTLTSASASRSASSESFESNSLDLTSLVIWDCWDGILCWRLIYNSIELQQECPWLAKIYSTSSLSCTFSR